MTDSPEPEIPDFAALAADPEIAPLLHFDPVPRKNERVDGWTAEKQRVFIVALAALGSSGRAAHVLEMRQAGVDKLRKSEGAESFSAAWERALEIHAARRTGRLRETLQRLQSQLSTPADGEAPAQPACPPIPVVCDKCAAEGAAGDEAFADIPYLLAFEPVPRPAHDRLWDPATQRAFVAALAVTGSVERAARSIRRHGFAVDKLRKSRGAREFNEACEAALDVARQREFAKMGGRLSELGSGADDGSLEAAQQTEYEAARARIQMRLTNCRRLYLWEISEDEDKRAAWELLCGPTDWEKAKRPIRGYAPSDAAGEFETGTPNMRDPSMILPVQNGWLAEMTGGEDKTAELRNAIESAETKVLPGTGRGTGEAGGGAPEQGAQGGGTPQPPPPPHAVPRIINMNDPDAYQRLCPREDRPWIPAGSLPREPRWPRKESPVQVSGGSEEEAQQAFKEWQAHVDTGRIGKKADS